jgi:hypothetical protein
MRVAARLANGFALDLVKLGSLAATWSTPCCWARSVRPTSPRSPAARAAAAVRHPRRRAAGRPAPAGQHQRDRRLLRIPFETARRRITALKAIGVIHVTPQGVIVLQALLNSPSY